MKLMNEMPMIAAPEGYALKFIFQYPKSLSVVIFFLFVGVIFLLFGVERIIGHSLFPPVDNTTWSFVVAFTLPAADFTRRLLQRFLSHLFGYMVSFKKMTFLGPLETYSAEPGQFQRRGHIVIIAFAPLCFFLLLGAFLFVGIHGDVGNAVRFFVLVGITRSIGDMYTLWRLSQLPSKTLLYGINTKEKMVFEPLY